MIVTHSPCRPESKFIQQIVKMILGAFLRGHLFSTELLVGIDSRVKEIISYLGIGLKDVRMLGICGMGGIGKSTIARVVYERLSYQFEASCFLADIREVAQVSGLICLQERLLSHILMERDTRISSVREGVELIRNRLHTKKILLFLDDVDQSEQLNVLAGKPDFFGLGSRIIITSRDQGLLRVHEVNQIYEPKLSNEEAIELFSLKSFKDKHPPKDYIEISNHFLNYANSLPLAINVLGSFLFGRSIEEWKVAFNMLILHPKSDILHLLEICVDGLKDVTRDVFLDIACFFKGDDKDHVIEILDCLGLYGNIGLSILIDKSRLKVSSDNQLWMHDLLQEMGRNIVRQKSADNPGSHSRLWLYEDIDRVLKTNEVGGYNYCRK